MDERRVGDLTDDELSKALQERKESIRPVNRSNLQQPDLLADSIALNLISRCRGIVQSLTAKLVPVLSEECKGDAREKISPVIDELSNLFDAIEALYERVHI